MKKICVIGAGITGMTTAYMLHEAGFDVTIITRESGPGTGASRTNAMQLCYGTIAPYAGWGDIKKYAKYLLHSTESSPVYISDKLSAQAIEFYMQSGLTAFPPIYRHTRYRLYELAQESKSHLDNFRSLHPQMDFHYKQTGKLRLFENDASRAAEEKNIEALNERYNSNIQILDGADIYKMEPALEHKSQKIIWGTFEPENASGSSWAMCQCLHEYLSGSDRYHFIGDSVIKGFRQKNKTISGVILTDRIINADAFVMSAGTGSAPLLKMLNMPIAMMPIQGYSFTLDEDPMNLTACFSDITQKFAMNSFDGGLRISGLMDFTGPSGDMITARAEYLKKTVLKTFPNLNLDNAIIRTGLRPVMGDSYPMIGKRRYQNLYLNTGHGVYGWTLAFGSAARVTDQITESV